MPLDYLGRNVEVLRVLGVHGHAVHQLVLVGEFLDVEELLKRVGHFRRCWPSADAFAERRGNSGQVPLFAVNSSRAYDSRKPQDWQRNVPMGIVSPDLGVLIPRPENMDSSQEFGVGVPFLHWLTNVNASERSNTKPWTISPLHFGQVNSAWLIADSFWEMPILIAGIGLVWLSAPSIPWLTDDVSEMTVGSCGPTPLSRLQVRGAC